MKRAERSMENMIYNPYSVKISPKKFIVHVSCSSNRKTINSQGITAKIALHKFMQKGVFAHNSMHPDLHWYPLNSYEDIGGGSVFSKLDMYDFWVIDTSIASNNWFLDTIGENDFLKIRRDFHLTKGLYIMTKEDVPRNAIKLYKFQTDEYWDQKGYGAHHFQSKKRFRPLEF